VRSLRITYELPLYPFLLLLCLLISFCFFSFFFLQGLLRSKAFRDLLFEINFIILAHFSEPDVSFLSTNRDSLLVKFIKILLDISATRSRRVTSVPLIFVAYTFCIYFHIIISFFPPFYLPTIAYHRTMISFFLSPSYLSSPNYSQDSWLYLVRFSSLDSTYDRFRVGEWFLASVHCSYRLLCFSCIYLFGLICFAYFFTPISFSLTDFYLSSWLLVVALFSSSFRFSLYLFTHVLFSFLPYFPYLVSLIFIIRNVLLSSFFYFSYSTSVWPFGFLIRFLIRLSDGFFFCHSPILLLPTYWTFLT